MKYKVFIFYGLSMFSFRVLIYEAREAEVNMDKITEFVQEQKELLKLEKLAVLKKDEEELKQNGQVIIWNECCE